MASNSMRRRFPLIFSLYSAYFPLLGKPGYPVVPGYHDAGGVSRNPFPMRLRNETVRPSSRGLLTRPPSQWLILIVLSLVFSALFFVMRVSAALLLGPMVAGIVMAASTGTSARSSPGSSAGVSLWVAQCFDPGAESALLRIASANWLHDRADHSAIDLCRDSA